MEKKKAHYNLTLIKELIKSDDYKITRLAEDNAALDFGYTEKQIIKIIEQLKPIDLYKSMTMQFDSTKWQDVYNKRINTHQTAYIKLQIIKNKTIIIQFKQK
jgi:hypothetical protein